LADGAGQRLLANSALASSPVLESPRSTKRHQDQQRSSDRAALDWEGVLAALHNAHIDPRPLTGDFFIGDADYRQFSRGVILPGRGAEVCDAGRSGAASRARIGGVRRI
jgi:hypothetical protein